MSKVYVVIEFEDGFQQFRGVYSSLEKAEKIGDVFEAEVDEFSEFTDEGLLCYTFCKSITGYYADFPMSVSTHSHFQKERVTITPSLRFGVVWAKNIEEAREKALKLIEN